MTLTKVVAITGCDSGLGWALAARMAREGLTTVAGMLDTETEAAAALKKYCVRPYPLDVTKDDSVAGFRNYVKEVVDEDPDNKLYAIVNNAGVMTVGDFEWQTGAMVRHTLDVNLMGAMRVTAALLPDVRPQAKQVSLPPYPQLPNPPRIISVASHCGLHALPGFAAYSASKAGLIAWTRALRVELVDHGVKAVAFVPGGFVGSSKILSQQSNYGQSMLDHLNDEQRAYYGPRITALTNYMSLVSSETRYDSVKDEQIIETFMQALLDENPKEIYKVESFRYMFYYNLFKMPLPESAYNWLVKKFLTFPEK